LRVFRDFVIFRENPAQMRNTSLCSLRPSCPLSPAPCSPPLWPVRRWSPSARNSRFPGLLQNCNIVQGNDFGISTRTGFLRIYPWQSISTQPRQEITVLVRLPYSPFQHSPFPISQATPHPSLPLQLPASTSTIATIATGGAACLPLIEPSRPR
jgi:hypothetical protein